MVAQPVIGLNDWEKYDTQTRYLEILTIQKLTNVTSISSSGREYHRKEKENTGILQAAHRAILP